jgi:transposase-like protein
MAAPPKNKYAKGNPGGGRPEDFKREYVEQAEKLCKLGATDKELADFFNVSETTINNWKKKHQDFSLALKKGKTLADAEVADRLYQRAMGFEHDSEEIKLMYDKETNQQVVERVPIRKIYPPDTVAAIFWLKNRQKDKWRDKQEIEANVTNRTVIIDTTGSDNQIYPEAG